MHAAYTMLILEKLPLIHSKSGYMPLCVSRNHAAAAAKSLQSCPTLCDPMDSSPPGSSIHGIFQARVLGWVAIAFSVYESQTSPKLALVTPYYNILLLFCVFLPY